MDDIVHPLLGTFSIIKKIGSGSFATVYLGYHTELQYPAAIKIFNSNNGDDIRESFNITKQITHPFICKDFDLIKTSNGQNCLIMEYVEGQTLLEYANTHYPLSNQDIRAILGQIIIAVEFLHFNNIIHRDLKCENVLIDKNKNIRLIDLNFSCPNGILHSTMCGSPGYIAPEIIKNELYTDSVDIWSMGILLYAITYGRLPYQNNNVYALFKLIISDEPSFPHDSDVDANLVDLIKKMLVKDPNRRITIQEIKNHPFFTSGTTEKNYIFSKPRINYYINDPLSKVNPQMHIIQQMKLSLSDSLILVNELKSGKITHNTLTYSILYKIYISNVQIKNYSHSFQCIIHEKSNPAKKEGDLPLLDTNESSKGVMPSLSHSTSYDGIAEKEDLSIHKGNKQVDLQLFLNSNVQFRRFSSLAKPIAGINRRKLSAMKSVPQLKQAKVINESNFAGEGTVSLGALPQLKIHE